MPVTYKPKRPDWERYVGVDFADAAEFKKSPPDTIVSASVISVVVGDAADLDVGTPSFSGTVVSFLLKRGVLGRKYVLLVPITTSSGAKLSKEIGIQVTNDAG